MRYRRFRALTGEGLPAGAPGRRPAARTARVPYVSIDGVGDRVRQLQIGLDGEREPLLLDQALDALLPDGERLERLAAVRGVERFPERPAGADPGQQLKRVQEVALAGGVRTEQHRQRLELHLDVGQGLVTLDVDSLQHAMLPACSPISARKRDGCLGQPKYESACVSVRLD